MLVLPSTSDVATPSNTTPPSPWMASTVHKKAHAFSRVRNKAERDGEEEDSGSAADRTHNNLPTRALMGVFTPPEKHAAAKDMRQLSDLLDGVSLRGDQRTRRQKVRRGESQGYRINMAVIDLDWVDFHIGLIFILCTG